MKYRKIYLLSGLGVDGRVFNNIDLREYQPQLIDWISPRNDESISNYAQLLAARLEPNSILIGLSFGGMVAIEIARHLPISKIILVSSASSFRQIPWLFRLWNWSSLLKLLPRSFFLKSNPMTFWLFGIKREQDKTLLSRILADTDYDFFSWAIQQIAQWKNTEIDTKLVHLHGTKDRLLRQPNNTSLTKKYRIKEAGHFMIITHSGEIEEILRKELRS